MKELRSPVSVLLDQLQRLRGPVVPPEHYVRVHLGEHESVVVRAEHITPLHADHGGRAAPVSVLAQLLGGRVDRLPTGILRRYVVPFHPHLVPHVEIPAERETEREREREREEIIIRTWKFLERRGEGGEERKGEERR